MRKEGSLCCLLLVSCNISVAHEYLWVRPYTPINQTKSSMLFVSLILGLLLTVGFPRGHRSTQYYLFFLHCLLVIFPHLRTVRNEYKKKISDILLIAGYSIKRNDTTFLIIKLLDRQYLWLLSPVWLKCLKNSQPTVRQSSADQGACGRASSE